MMYMSENITVDGRVVNYVRGECTTSTVQLRLGDRRQRDQQARPSTSFVDNTIDLPWRSFPSPQFGTKFQRKVSLPGS